MGWFRRNQHDEEQLSAYLDGELNARQAENVERHLAVCDSCSALLEELRETRALLSALPAQTPRRSFVLGAEYARAPVREAPAPAKRFNLAFAPAVALSVFVALLVVDVGNFASTSSDDSAGTFTAATSREAADGDAAGTGSAGSIGGATQEQVENGSDATAAQPMDAPSGTGPAPAAGEEANGTEPVESPEEPPAALSAEALPTPEEGDTALRADGEAADESLPEPEALEAPQSEDEGISTLRVLQILAGAAFLASGFYVFVWPRLSRGGS